jgi:hypothetical protein
VTSDPTDDRRFRFQVAAELWSACGEAIAPNTVLAIASRVNDELVVGDDVREVVRREVEDAGVPEHLVPKVATLVLWVMRDRADAELAAIRSSRRIGD